jgi:hypothetical protein
VLSLNQATECNEPVRLNVPTELSILSEIPSQIYKDLRLHERVLVDETLQLSDKFGVIPAFYMKKSLQAMSIKKADYKYTCINVYKLKALRLLTDKFQDHFYNEYNKQLKLTHFLEHIVISATLSDELASKINVLKRGISILDVYSIMKYLRINCIVFDKQRAIQYTLSEINESVMVFRFNNSLDMDYCGSYDTIYKMFTPSCVY